MDEGGNEDDADQPFRPHKYYFAAHRLSRCCRRDCVAQQALGFVEHYRYGDPANGAQMHLGDAWIMLRQARPGSGSPAQLGYATQSLTVFVEDVQVHFDRTKSAGAKME